MGEHTKECENCEDEFEAEWERVELCPTCAEERAMEAISNIEPPEDGWPRGSDMDRL